MTKQAARLSKWFENWHALFFMMTIDKRPDQQFTGESQEVLDALIALSED